MLKLAYHGRKFPPHFSDLQGQSAQSEPGSISRYEGLPITTQYWSEFGKYAKFGLLRAEISPIFGPDGPGGVKRAGAATDMMAYLLVHGIERISKNILKLA